MRIAAALFVTSLLLLGCTASQSTRQHQEPPQFIATPWLEADALFHRDPRWLGADGAWTVDLGNDRILWLFADTFIDLGDAPSRRSPTVDMVSNTLAIQTGADPSTADIEFFWRVSPDGAPAAFFADDADIRHWPGHAVRIGETLLVFLMHVRGADGGLGFEVFDWSVVAIENPDDSPAAWRIRSINTPRNADRIVVGSASVLNRDGFLYAFGSKEDGQGQIFLTRLPLADVERANLQAMTWWSASGQWVANDCAQADATPVFEHRGTECTVHFDADSRLFLNVHSVGLGPADLMLRTAPALAGPWSEDALLHRPEESDWPGVMIYQGKAHPALIGADLVATYCTNAFDFADLINDDRIYYPRFVRLNRTVSDSR